MTPKLIQTNGKIGTSKTFKKRKNNRSHYNYNITQIIENKF
jgi:hypothetical protein